MTLRNAMEAQAGKQNMVFLHALLLFSDETITLIFKSLIWKNPFLIRFFVNPSFRSGLFWTKMTHFTHNLCNDKKDESKI